MWILTGGAGFIGSNILELLNSKGITDILVVDNLGSSEKWKNLIGLKFTDYLHKDQFLDLLPQIQGSGTDKIEGIIHMGACSSTTETDAEYMLQNNYYYSRELASWALKNKTRFIYASSAAVYGEGELGFSDNSCDELKPLNVYAYSKQLFDSWAISTGAIKEICGLRFFNVFGPKEAHKGDMRSVVLKSYEQISKNGKISLFKSYRPEYKDGEQKRDFIYVKDCAQIIWKLIEKPNINGIYNLGTGEAKSWNDLARAVFAAMQEEERIDYIDMPDTLKKKYQYFTQAELGKFRTAFADFKFTELNQAVKDYISVI